MKLKKNRRKIWQFERKCLLLPAIRNKNQKQTCIEMQIIGGGAAQDSKDREKIAAYL